MASGGGYQQNMSAETFDFVCTTCAEDNKTLEAVKYCVECSRYCCQTCTDAHKFPALRSHNLLDVRQGMQQVNGQQSSFPEFPTERCSKHKGKVMDMYCEGHDVVGCSTCFFKDHKSCHDSHIYSIPDMIDTIYNLSDCTQTRSFLKDMMVSMETVSKSKDDQLQTLTKSKKDALDKVMIFQKALEALVRKAAESSKQHIEAAYKELETEMMNDQRKVEVVGEDLKMAYDKLNGPQSNRVQHFVWTKLGQELLKEAGDVKIKQAVHHSANIQISFYPDQGLMEYMKALPGIGQIQKHDLYKIKESRDVSLDLTGYFYNSRGCCLTHDNQLLVTACGSRTLRRIDVQKKSFVDYCTLDSTPYGVCCISKHEVAVACQADNKVQFVSVDTKMTPTRQIQMKHALYGIASNDGKLYVTNSGASLYVYDMAGTLLRTITQDIAGNSLFLANKHITFNESGSRMFVGDDNKGLVCFDDEANYLFTINDPDLRFGDGVCVDGRGNVFVVVWGSNNVIQYKEDGQKVGVVVKQGDGLLKPIAVCFHPGLNTMFVTQEFCNVVQIYEFE